jgi:O-antigen ligase
VAINLYALKLTNSRGGFLAMVVAVVVLFYSRFRLKKTLILSALILPIFIALYAGRQTEISADADTAKSRIQLWSEALTDFRAAPVFGIGMGKFEEEAGLVAHNSYLHCYVELGFIGGTCFLGAFLYSFYGLHRLGHRGAIADPELARIRPYLLGIVAAYATGYFSLSRPYVTPTYLVLGLVTAFLCIAPANRRWAAPPISRRLLAAAFAAGVVFIGVSYVFIRLFVRWD